MATLNQGDGLKLSELQSATGAGDGKMSSAAGESGTPIRMSDFAIDSIDSISGFTYVVENTSDVYELIFSGAGSRFDRISSQPANFDWNVQFAGSNTTNYISIVGSPSSSCDISVSEMNPQDPSSQTELMTIKEHLISCSFNDSGFNNHATNFNTIISKTIYSVDSYDGNDGALCLTSNSPIELWDGTIIDAGDIIEGDELVGFQIDTLPTDSDSNYLDWDVNTLNMLKVPVTVKNITYTFSDKIYNINSGEITGTPEHPMLVKDNSDGLYRFKQLYQINVGDMLIKENEEIEVISVTSNTSTEEVVSIDVEIHDTYIVNGYVTHNKGGNTHTDLPAPDAPTALSWNNGTDFLSWTPPSSTGDTGITAYDIQIDNTSAAFGSLVVNETEWNGTTYDGTGLVNGSYWARVRAIDQGLAGAWSTTLNFTQS